MRQLDAASNVGFAFALELGSPAQGLDDEPPVGAAGELRWSGEDGAAVPSTGAVAGDLQELFQAVCERQPMRLPCPSGGEIVLTWF